MVQRFLEWHPFQAVSRLSYSYFMVHILVVFYRIFSVREVYAMTNSMMVSISIAFYIFPILESSISLQLQNFILDFLLTLIVAYLFYCMVECPIVNLLNLYQGKIFYDIQQYKPRGENNNNNNNNNIELRGQADINGNGHIVSGSNGNGKVNPDFVHDHEDMLAYPPNIVVEEFNSVKNAVPQQQQQHHNVNVEVQQSSRHHHQQQPQQSSTTNEFEMNSPSSSSARQQISDSRSSEVPANSSSSSSSSEQAESSRSETIATSRL